MDVVTSRGEVDERDRFAPATDAVALTYEALPVPTPGHAFDVLWPIRASFRLIQWPRRLLERETRGSVIQALRGALNLEIERGVPFLFAPVFLAAGAMIYFSLATEPGDIELSVAAIATIAPFLVFRHRPAVGFVLAIPALLAGGMMLAKLETWRASTKMLGGEISTTVSGRVESIDHLPNGRIRLTLAVLETKLPTLRYAPDRIRASARTIPLDLGPGSVVSGLVRLQPPSGPVRPGSYDFAFESYFDRIGANGFFMRGPVLVPTAEDRSLLLRAKTWVEDARMRIAGRIATRIGGPEGEIAAALMVGVRAGIPNEANEALRRAGLYHIISISGLHMALVAAAVMGTLRAALAMLPGFASRWPVKKYAAAIAIAAIAGYLFISGGEVAAQRSFIMLAVMLAAVTVDRAALTMRNLAISALVVIIMTPHEVMGPSFQMSFAATAALVGSYAAWSNRSRTGDGATMPPRAGSTIIVRRVLLVCVGLAMTSLIAGLATAPFGVYHFQRVSPLGLAANLAVMPIVSLIVVPSAVLAALAMPFGADGLFLDLMGNGLSAMMSVARWFSERSPLDAVGMISGSSVVLLTIALVIATMATTWLRLAALVFAIPGLLTLSDVRTPDVLVAEDGKLVGLATGGRSIALNRTRASDFTLDNWKRTLGAETVIKPSIRDLNGVVPDKVTKAADHGFVCIDTQCVATHKSGATILFTPDAETARNACSTASVIVLDDPTTALACADKNVVLVTSRDLARGGSAAIYLAGQETEQPEISFAINGLDRPWHRHRSYSRAARGIAPYTKNPDQTKSQTAPSAVQAGPLAIPRITTQGIAPDA